MKVSFMLNLTSFEKPIRAVIVGASGGIGKAVCRHLLTMDNVEMVYLLSRSDPNIEHKKTVYVKTDITIEDDIARAAAAIKTDGPPALIFVATGFLHDQGQTPEKTIRSASIEAFQASFNVNCFGPALIAKHFLPLTDRNSRAVFAALSARVGSISDNRLGGWYAYRSAKAALNMIIKTLSIEFSRRSKNLTIIGLHPGTVDTALSEPFQGNVPDGKLFTPQQSAAYLLSVIDNTHADQSGELLAWDGQTIPF